MGRVRVPDIKSSFEKVLGKGINRIFRLLEANLLETLSEEEDEVICEVHADGLRLSVEHVLLLLAEDFNVVLSLLLLLFFDYLLKVFFLLGLVHLQKSGCSQGDLVHLPPLALLFIVECHEVKWLLVLAK